MIKEYFNSTIKGIRERTENPFSTSNNTPFAGAYLIALLIYNWKIIFSLLNFDTKDSRVSKIAIISQYLEDSRLYERLGIPLIIAFATIVFYYFFNFISLGITTFFTRWFKSTILHFTDKSKNVPRQEFEEFLSKLEITRKKYEEIKKEYSESQSEIESYKTKLQNAQAESNGLSIEGDRMTRELEQYKAQLESLNSKFHGFEIISASYGLFNDSIDVKEIVESEFMWGDLLVENKKFKSDPIPNVLKELIIVYRAKAEIRTIVAIEHDVIKKIDDDLQIMSSELGLKKKNYLMEQIKAIS